MEDEKENDDQEKQNECGSSSHQTVLPPHWPVQQPSSSSSSSPEPQRIQEAKKHMLTDPQTHSPSQTDQTITPSPNSGPVDSPLQAAAAQLRLMKRKERTEYKLTLIGGQPIANKSKRQRGPDREWTPPGPSPLGQSLSPHERVRNVVSVLKKYLRLDSLPGPSQPHLGPVTKPTIEKVILMLDEYVEGISRSVTDEEMEGLLRDFQRNVDVDDDEICWYGLIKESNEAFWKSLTEHFICETFFESDLEDEVERDDHVTESDTDDGDDDDDSGEE